MFLRLLLKFIRPSNEQLRSKTTGEFAHLKIRLYQFLLRWLLKTYLHYAISDTIVIGNGNIKIVHEFRDLAFESELVRNKIDFKSEIISHSIPLLIRKSKAVHHFHFFKFKNLLSLYINGKELFIKHDDVCSIDGTIKGEIKCSLKNSCIFQPIIEVLSSYNRIEVTDNTVHKQQISSLINNRPSNQRQKLKDPSQNIFEREQEILSIMHQKGSKTNNAEIVCDHLPKSIAKKGFDIDTSF